MSRHGDWLRWSFIIWDVNYTTSNKQVWSMLACVFFSFSISQLEMQAAKEDAEEKGAPFCKLRKMTGLIEFSCSKALVLSVWISEKES